MPTSLGAENFLYGPLFCSKGVRGDSGEDMEESIEPYSTVHYRAMQCSTTNPPLSLYLITTVSPSPHSLTSPSSPPAQACLL